MLMKTKTNPYYHLMNDNQKAKWNTLMNVIEKFRQEQRALINSENNNSSIKE